MFVTDMYLSQKQHLDPLSVYRLPYVRSECAFQFLNGRGLLELSVCSQFRIDTSVEQLLAKELLKEDYNDLGN